MLKDIVEVKPLPDRKLWVRFEDGISGVYDVGANVKFRGVFATLEMPEEFAKVTVNPDLGVVCWPSGADLDSDVIYAVVTCKPIAFNQQSFLPA